MLAGVRENGRYMIRCQAASIRPSDPENTPLPHLGVNLPGDLHAHPVIHVAKRNKAYYDQA